MHSIGTKLVCVTYTHTHPYIYKLYVNIYRYIVNSLLNAIPTTHTYIHRLKPFYSSLGILTFTAWNPSIHHWKFKLPTGILVFPTWNLSFHHLEGLCIFTTWNPFLHHLEYLFDLLKPVYSPPGNLLFTTWNLSIYHMTPYIHHLEYFYLPPETLKFPSWNSSIHHLKPFYWWPSPSSTPILHLLGIITSGWEHQLYIMPVNRPMFLRPKKGDLGGKVRWGFLWQLLEESNPAIGKEVVCWLPRWLPEKGPGVLPR
jgi:hypothetical protein